MRVKYQYSVLLRDYEESKNQYFRINLYDNYIDYQKADKMIHISIGKVLDQLGAEIDDYLIEYDLINVEIEDRIYDHSKSSNKG